MFKSPLPTLLVLLLALASSAHAADYLWWEGESPDKSNFNNQAFAPKNLAKPEILSNNNWLNHAAKAPANEPLFAEYTLTIPDNLANKPLYFWTRKFWKHGPFRFRFDPAAEWSICPADCALADNADIQKFVNANWVSLGEFQLTPGKHTLRIELLAKPGEDATACFDAFLLTPAPFIPRGKLKPGESYNLVEPNHFPWEPNTDLFTDSALLNLRPLNEKSAGQSGYITTKDSDFLTADGKPIRFWAVNLGPDFTKLPKPQQDYLAKNLAKRGVNMVRIHGAVADPTQPNPKIPAETITGYHRLIASLKDQGIYTELSIYFPVWYDSKPFGQIFFDPTLQANYRDLWKQLLTTPDSAGKTLATEPAVALLELVNEDSLFFWTFNEKSIPAEKLRLLDSQFTAWCIKRYGNLDNVRAAFNKAKHPRDTATRLGLFDAWFLTADGLAKSGTPERAKIQARFFAETQRKFYAESTQFLKQDLKSKSLVVASNWITADDSVLGPLERWSYDACDVRDRHGYFGGEHKGPTSGWAVAKGDSYVDRAGVLEPTELPLQFVQSPHHPSIITELGWTNPNRFRAENVLLSAAAGSIQGADGLFFFAGNNFAWSHQFDKFPVSSPAVLGQFPANALMYRRGDLKTGAPVIEQALTDQELWSLEKRGPAATETLDALRAADKKSGTPSNVFDALTFYTGPVFQSVEKEKQNKSAPTSTIDHKSKIVRDQSNQMKWDFASGLFTVNTPKTQAACGFLAKAGKIPLADFTLESANEFAAITVTSLDGANLADSKRILIQAFTEEKPYGFKTKKGVIENLGQAPMQILLIDAKITLKSTGWTATPLDPNGYALQKEPVTGPFTLPKNAMYTVLQR